MIPILIPIIAVPVTFATAFIIGYLQHLHRKDKKRYINYIVQKNINKIIEEEERKCQLFENELK